MWVGGVFFVRTSESAVEARARAYLNTNGVLCCVDACVHRVLARHLHVPTPPRITHVVDVGTPPIDANGRVGVHATAVRVRVRAHLGRNNASHGTPQRSVERGTESWRRGEDRRAPRHAADNVAASA
jgi:hypothetical protein